MQGQDLNKNSLYFGALKEKFGKPDSLALTYPSEPEVSAIGEQAAMFKVQSVYNNPSFIVSVNFEPGDYVGVAKVQLVLKNKQGKELDTFPMGGISRPALEGKNEPTLAEVFRTFGVTTNPGWTTLENTLKPELQGDELKPSLFVKAGKGSVEIVPLARYSPPFELPFGYYINLKDAPQLHQIGTLSDSKKFHEQQTLMPGFTGKDIFDPGASTFGIYNTGPTHTSFIEDRWNKKLFPTHTGHAARIYPLKINGKVIENQYLICFEEAANGDYQDYVFLIKNVKAVDVPEGE